MALLSLSEAKLHLGIPSADTSDDTLLTALISAAQSAIEAHCGRSLEAATATRSYGPAAVSWQLLRLDADLLAVTTLTNGDGSVVASQDYGLWPHNVVPAWAIRLKTTQSWRFSDADSVISVLGSWGYAATAPDMAVHVMRELVEDLYRSPDWRRGQGGEKGAASTLVASAVSLSPRLVILLAPFRRVL